MRDDLWAIVHDPAVGPRARFAAAVAIGGADDGTRARLREIATESAHPQLRIALESIGNRSDDELDAELEAIEPERAARLAVSSSS